MSKIRFTVSLNKELLTAVSELAVRAGKTNQQVIEEALQHHLRLDVLGRLWTCSAMTEQEAVELAIEAQYATR